MCMQRAHTYIQWLPPSLCTTYIRQRFSAEARCPQFCQYHQVACSNISLPSAESLTFTWVLGIHTPVLTLYPRATPQPFSHVLILDLITIYHRHAHAHKTYGVKVEGRQIGREKDEEDRRCGVNTVKHVLYLKETLQRPTLCTLYICNFL